MRRTLAALALVTLLVSACEARTEITVRPDGSGTLALVLAAPRGQAVTAEALATARTRFEQGERWTVSSHAEGGNEGFRAVIEFADVTQLAQRIEEAREQSGSGVRFERFAVTRTDGGWSLDARAPALSGESQEVPPEQLERVIDIQLWVALPGEAVQHNADGVERDGDATRFRWSVSRAAALNRPLVMTATTREAGGSSFPLLWVLLGVAVLGGAAVVVMRGRGRPPAPAPHAPVPARAPELRADPPRSDEPSGRG